MNDIVKRKAGRTEVNDKMKEMTEQMLNKIASLAMESMLYEVSATPKPGLVDRNNSGAHHDMDYFTFMSSAAALHDSFDKFVQIGWQYRQRPIQEVLLPLREAGITAEFRMFSFTQGINTHKGMIFTLGILCGCAGWLLGRKPLTFDNLSDCSKQMCQGICEKEYAGLEQKAELTKGERMYLEYGCTGVRGEVEKGYQTIKQYSLPCYTKLRQEQVSVNDALVQTLLHLVADTWDTNILSRHDMETMRYCQKYAKRVLCLGGIFTERGKAELLKMDNDFIEKYISPGGCADLLAVTHFVYCLEHTDMLKYNIVQRHSGNKKHHVPEMISGN